MNAINITITAVLLFIGAPGRLWGHGVNHTRIQGGIGLKVTYESGEPMARAGVRIFAPDDYKKPVLELVTDRNGQFLFKPDKAGTWIVMVSDETGHGVREDILVGDDLLATGDGKERGSLSYWQKWIMALCVIWGLLGTALFFKRKKS